MMLHQEDVDEFLDDYKGPSQMHFDCILPQVGQGKWRCMSEHSMIKQIPAKIETLRFREKEMSMLLESLL